MRIKHVITFIVMVVLLFSVLTTAFSDSLANALDLSGFLVYLPLIQDGSGIATGPLPPTPTANASATSSPSSTATATATSTATATASATPTSTPTSTPTPEPGPITRVSRSSTGIEANGGSSRAAISGDGRYVAFDSLASNLVADDTNNVRDVFVHDRQTGQTTRVSVGNGGVQANAASFSPALSGDGRFVAFRSDASNLVPGDTNGHPDIFVHDRLTHTTELVSISYEGIQGNDVSLWPSISANGRFVAFYSFASNLVAGDTNGKADVFLYDREIGEMKRVSISTGGEEGNGDSTSPVVSADGRYVAFYSWATDLVEGPTNGMPDILIHDSQSGETARVSVANADAGESGLSGALSISDDGQLVAFSSNAGDLVDDDTNGDYDVFVTHWASGVTTRVSVTSAGAQVSGVSDYPSLSADGRFVAFDSLASDLVANDTNDVADIFVHDRQTGETRRLSLGNSGTEGNGSSQDPAISANGCYVAFQSTATNLVGSDTNSVSDIFVYDCN